MALGAAVRALGIGAGDEVIMPALTFVSTAFAVAAAGAVPVFVDIDPVTRTIDPHAVEASVTPRTRAVIPVHMHGLMADMTAIRALADRHSLSLIEDCAQAAGATDAGRHAGSVGDIGCFSMWVGKKPRRPRGRRPAPRPRPRAPAAAPQAHRPRPGRRAQHPPPARRPGPDGRDRRRGHPPPARPAALLDRPAACPGPAVHGCLRHPARRYAGRRARATAHVLQVPADDAGYGLRQVPHGPPGPRRDQHRAGLPPHRPPPAGPARTRAPHSGHRRQPRPAAPHGVPPDRPRTHRRGSGPRHRMRPRLPRPAGLLPSALRSAGRSVNRLAGAARRPPRPPSPPSPR